MSFRTTTLLFGLLLAVLWTFGMVLAMRRSTLDQGFVSPQFAQDTESNVNSVEIAKDGKSLIFTKAEDGAWFMTQTGYKQKVRVPTNKVTDLIREVQTARHSANTDVSRDLGLFNLNKPTVVVTLKTDKGKEIQFFVGKISGDNLLAFCNSSERKKDVLAVTRSSISSVFLDADKFRSNTLLDDKQPPTGIALKETDAQGKSTELALQKFKNKYWRFVQPRYGPADYEGGPSLKNDQSLSGLLATVTGLVAAEFEPFDSPVGIDPATAKLRIEVDFGNQEDDKDKGDKKAKSDSKKQILLIGGEVPGREKDKEMYYARLDHEGADKSVVRVGKKQLDAVFALMKKPEVMRSRDVAQFDPKLVDAVELWRDGDFVVVYERKVEGQVNWLVFASDKAQRLGSDDAIEDEKTGWLAAIVGRQAIAEKDLEAIDKPERVKELDAMFADPMKIKATVKVFSDGILPEPKKETPKTDPKKEEKKKEGDKDDPKKTDPKKEEPKYDAKKDTNPPKFKADAKPVVTLSFIPIGEDNKVMVKREAPDNDPIYFKLTKAAYEKIVPPEMGLTFYDTGISPFSSTDAFKFELLRVSGKDKETFILERDLPKEKTDEEKKKEAETKAAEAKKAAEEKKNELGDDKKGDPKEKKTDDKKEPNPHDWKLVEPKNFGKADVEQRDVDGLLRQLGDLRAERWVRQVSKDGLAQYG
ncbi:MAG TPA: hypothetical protein VE988_06160, partial [Gemmataceae bacterium]|nr:hypothetical protein [Gemmataceae bacterium]